MSGKRTIFTLPSSVAHHLKTWECVVDAAVTMKLQHESHTDTCASLAHRRYGSRDPTSAKMQELLSKQAGATADTVAAACSWADIIVLTVPGEELHNA
jgi:predicted dinucleotide-binding enzyme